MAESKEYPKWIETKTEVAKTKDGKPIYERVLVQNAKEEQKALGAPDKVEETDKKEEETDPKKPKWPNK